MARRFGIMNLMMPSDYPLYVSESAKTIEEPVRQSGIIMTVMRV